MIQFRVEPSAVHALEADVVIRLVDASTLKTGTLQAIPGLPAVLDQAVGSYVNNGLFKAEPGDVQVIPTLGLVTAAHVVYIGYGGEPLGMEGLRKAGAAAARTLKKLKAASASVLVEVGLYGGSESCSTERAAQALTEGIILGHRTRQPRLKETPAEQVIDIAFTPVQHEGGSLASERADEWEAGMNRGRIFGDAVAYARGLTNLPGNMLTPEMLAMEAEALAGEMSLDIEVIDEWSAAEQGMGGLLAVGQGSANPPRMIVVHYEGAPESKEKLALVGKGITFDTGGISLKRADGMEEMISDMGGAAAVLGAMRIIASLKPAVNVIAVIPAAENMPSDRALKPGDVITTMSGRTIEIVNTDAEGRVVLADGLTTAIQRGATRIIDVATLTGAVMVSLADVATGAVTNDETFLNQLVQVSNQTGERIWPLPSYPEFRKLLDSDAADLKNSAGRYGGASTGGLFIGVFAEELPWVHLDIGGTAWLYKDRGWETKGATGVMTRTLAEYVIQQG
ncbi:leucyl aminopeptidase [Paenibacillus tarimensis]|uniref:leucyl aminopeptidase n=1 Tax=Paenibacillus tarimensis TaxID=416012 RepID=UPI001F1E888B|nr:leucyl aminopeptidase [Paenibacillus tarimensis]MCF2942850.1 leucyl aminopeptidase [Paenibacillus tarimensis]